MGTVATPGAMRGTTMTIPFSWARTLETIGSLGRRTDRWAAQRHLRHRDRRLAALHIFDGSRFGYRYRSGGMGRLAQYRTGWWRELLDAVPAEDVSSVVVRTDQVRWIVGQLDPAPAPLDESGDA